MNTELIYKSVSLNNFARICALGVAAMVSVFAVSLGMRCDGEFSTRVILPPYKPSYRVFVLVWVVLYAMLAASWIYVTSNASNHQTTLNVDAAVIAFLTLSALWYVSFFAYGNVKISAVILVVSIMVMYLVSYLAWTAIHHNSRTQYLTLSLFVFGLVNAWLYLVIFLNLGTVRRV